MKISFRGKLRKFFHANRIVTVIVLLLLQIVWMAYFVYAITNSHYWLPAISFTVQLVFVLIILGTTRNPAYKIGWIILVSTFSVFGCVFYLLYGFNLSNKKLKAKINKSVEENGVIPTEVSAKEKIELLGKTQACISQYLENKGFALFENSNAQYFPCGEQFFPDFLEQLKKAEKFIFLETFIIDYGEIWSQMLDILKKKAEQGVKIKILYDDMGTISRLPKNYPKTINELSENIECILFNKVTAFLVQSINNRDHRKIAIIDGKVAYTGGMNFADEYANIDSPFGYWKDAMVKITGLAVNGFTKIYLDLFNAVSKNPEKFSDYAVAEETCEDGLIQPFATNPFNKTDIAFHVYLDMINRASRYVYISSPYLVPDNDVISSLIHASERGVDVRILTPYIPDKKIVSRLTRANFYALMQSGIKIYFYKPGFNHAKMAVFDDEVAFVGSANLDYMSLFLNFECGAMFYGGKVVCDLAKDFTKTFSESILVTTSDVKTGVVGKFVDAVLKTIEMLF